MKTMSHDEYVAHVRRYICQFPIGCLQSISTFLNSGSAYIIHSNFAIVGRVHASPEALHDSEELPGFFFFMENDS
jgi:hypothetical protein